MPLNRALREYWVKAGYKSTAGSAAVTKPPPRKYLRLYHLTTADHAISNIGLGRLKLARFSDLNDPFELLAVNFRERVVRNVVRDFKSTLDSHTGLLCFSADWTNPVLWSHYGQKHRGICLGFNVRKTGAEKVRYKDKRLLTQLEGGEPYAIDQDLQNLLLCTKYRHWRYEEEWRVFVKIDDAKREGRLHFRPFDGDLELAEVILGPQCDLPLREVRQLTSATHPSAVTFASRLAFKFFKVVPKESTIQIAP
jgi:hypothetical protein